MKRKLMYKIIQIVLIILLLLTSGFLFYSLILFNKLETFYIIMAAILIIYIGFLISYFLNKSFRKENFKKFFTVSIISFILSICFGILGYVIYSVYGKLEGFNKGSIINTTVLITFNDKYSKIKDITNTRVGIIDDESNIELYTLAMEIINDKSLDKKNEIVSHNSAIDLVKALYSDEVDLIFVNGNYADLFASFEEYADIGSRAIEVISLSKEMKKSETDADISSPAGQTLNEPFTVLLLGIDSASDGLKKNSAFNGDTIMLITFNPKTLNATMFSIPRDTYVKTACGNGQLQKINTSAYGGAACVIKTVQNITDIKIDYYVKMNFKGVVGLVDALGGIEVNVPYSFCEQNSSRQWGSNTVFVEKGKRTLSGEQALALSRNRYYPSKSSAMRKMCPDLDEGPRNDFYRGQNQQLVVEGILNQVKEVKSANKLMEIFDIISKNIDTNLSTDQILSFYGVAKNIISAKSIDVVNIQKTFLRGYDMMVYEPSLKGTTYAFFNWKGSLNDIIDLMKTNLGKKGPTLIKEFSFSINEIYTKEVAGNKSYSEAKAKMVPNFSAYSYSQSKNWGTSNGISIKILDIETGSEIPDLNGYTFISQSVHEKTLVSKAGKTINLNYKSKKIVIEDPVLDPTNQE